MNLVIEIPDDIADRITKAGIDLSRQALESFALEEFKSGRIEKFELQRLLGFGTRWKLDGFLKAHGIYEEMTLEDVDQDIADLKSIGL